MGNLELEPMLPAEHASAFQSQTANLEARLDGLLLTLASEGTGSPDAGEDRERLKDVPLEAILAAVERAGPDIGAPARIALHQQWISANATSPLLHAAWFNIGASFAQRGQYLNAAIAYGNALALRPDMYGAAINLGLLFEATGQPEEALATWKRAVQPDAVRVALEIQQGRLLEKLGRLGEAEEILRRVLLTNPAQPDVIHHWVHIRQKSCQWPVAPTDIPGISAAELVRNSGPLGILALTDDIDLQSHAAKSWVTRKTKPQPRRLAPLRPYQHQRIRIGYMSSDFCSHAMSYLITELFERHDRLRFEVFGYCSTKDDGTELRKRVLAAFDHCRIIRTLSDEQAAQVIRDDEIDVLIDLNGITDGSRLAVLRWGPAPIQATYLGFIGPIPMPELDYLLCDNMVVPPEYKRAYQPEPLAIGPIYQANDSKRTTGPPSSRAAAGLPQEGFVFCCFSKHYKITEQMFSAWMSILRQVEGSVLWLAEDNPYSKANMLMVARQAGVAEQRLIFAARGDPDLYLSHLSVANLFLDTFPYNAGTVASDAIRMHLPLVTLCGQAFASRMAASLLNILGAPRGITTTLSKYINIAVELANDPEAYGQYKTLFTAQAWSQTIGNIEGFTLLFEDTWSRIVRERRDPGWKSPAINGLVTNSRAEGDS